MYFLVGLFGEEQRRPFLLLVPPWETAAIVDHVNGEALELARLLRDQELLRLASPIGVS